VLATASAEGRIVVTVDRGLGDTTKFPPGSYAGMIVLRPDTDDKELFLEFLASVVVRPDIESFARCVVIVEPDRVRVRRPDND
jgi:hypothetical protein